MRILVPCLFILFVSFQPLSAQPTISQNKAPAWAMTYGYKDVSDTTQSVNGYAYLLVSRQMHLESKEEYLKVVMKVTSPNGLSTVASINESFDPTFQKLTFHEINIIRNGKTINKLNLAKFDVLRREEEMERAVYDKSYNAIYNISDVRVGDIVEYAFTRKGFNPAFGNHTFARLYLQYEVPVEKFAHRILCSPQRKITFKTHGSPDVPVKESQYGNLKSFEWLRENVPAVLIDDQYPSWYNPFMNVQFSDFQSWDELKTWATTLYTFPKLDNGGLKKMINTIAKSGKSDEDKIKECIRIAQGDIRYLSFSDGIHSYKPHSPELVYNQKYGDCKDKSFMLALMLQELGIASSPALVSTEDGYILPDILPNPWAFDHCIVQFTHKDSTYWIDPTLDAQVGPLKSYHFPTYYNALVIHDDNHPGLTSIPFAYKDSRIVVREEYSMHEVGGPTVLKVETTYYGDEANEIRGYFRSNTIEQINKDYLNFYAKDFPEISLSTGFKFKDDSVANIIVSSEEYYLTNFWKTEEKGKKTATMYAGVLASYLKKPSTRIRTMPLAISHPRDISQIISIHVPKKWEISDSETEIESEGFKYFRTRFYSNNIITLSYRYQSKANFISADAVEDHVARIDEAMADSGFEIYESSDEASTRSTTTNVNLIVVVLLVVAGAMYMFRRR